MLNSGNNGRILLINLVRKIMLASAVSSQILAKHGIASQTAFNDLLVGMAIDPLSPLSAESFAVKIMESLTTAESSLPDAQKQNNFGYSIGEGGAYRGSIKAAVAASFQVVA
jgi:hypothetical protein